MSVEEAIKQAENTLIRLEAYRMRCGGGRIHDTMVWIAVVSSYVGLLQRGSKADPQVLVKELTEGIEKAREFLIQEARAL